MYETPFLPSISIPPPKKIKTDFKPIVKCYDYSNYKNNNKKEVTIIVSGLI